MWLLNISKSPRKEKRFRATFCKCKVKNQCKGSNHTTTDFGLKGGSTYIDHKDDKKKENYIARHRVNENWNDPTTAGALSRFILWNKKTLKASIDDFKKRFNI